MYIQLHTDIRAVSQLEFGDINRPACTIACNIRDIGALLGTSIRAPGRIRTARARARGPPRHLATTQPPIAIASDTCLESPVVDSRAMMALVAAPCWAAAAAAVLLEAPGCARPSHPGVCFNFNDVQPPAQALTGAACCS
eukprot:COSAG02_NODE_35581_length_466_cov_0.896458_1_plen_139_part_01